MLLYTAACIHSIFKNGWHNEIRLRGISYEGLKENAFFLPLAALPIYNLLSLQQFEFRLSTAILMLSVSVCEELFFRGFLLRWLERKSVLFAVVASSTLFSILHCVNMKSMEPLYVGMQMLCAFSAGVCYCFVTIRGSSLLPPMVIHFLTNITASIETSSPVVKESVPGLWVCICIYLGYGTLLNRKINKLGGS